VLPDAVIDRQVSRQTGVWLVGDLKRYRISPFLAEGLDESLGLSVGGWRVGPGADVLEAEGSAGLDECFGEVGRAVVAHHLTAVDTLAVEPGHYTTQKTDRCCFLLISKNLHVCKPYGVVDGPVDPVVTDPSGTARYRLPMIRCPTSRKRASFLTSI